MFCQNHTRVHRHRFQKLLFKLPGLPWSDTDSKVLKMFLIATATAEGSFHTALGMD